MGLPYQQDIRNCFEIENGFDTRIFDEYKKRLEFASLRVVKHHEDNTLPVLRLAESMKDLEAAMALAEDWREKFEHIVCIGTGGSSSGGQSVIALRARNEKPKISFIDNVSVGPFETFLADLDWASTGFVVISKSGSTGETLAQFIIILQQLIERGLQKNVVAICEPMHNPLRQIAEAHGMIILDHDPKIGGRFSVLSLVGMLPAAMAGLDVEAIRRGAHRVWKDVYDHRQESQAALGAAVAVQAYKEHYCHAQVFMPYVEQLKPFSFWFRQLWAESLGKDGKGQTPIDALGTVDQHSQLQLYLDGPNDKLFTLIMEDVFRHGPAISMDLSPYPNLDYLKGAAIGDILAAHQKATAETLANNGRPSRIFKIRQLNEEVLGALFMHFMLETMLAADLLRVDAFDQPAVEQGKILVKEFLRARTNLKLDPAG